MNEDSKQEFKRLLNEAIKSVHIMGKNSPMSVQQYKSIFLGKHDRLMRGIKAPNLPDIESGSIKSRLLDLLKAELSEYLHNDKIGCSILKMQGGSMGGYDLEQILRSVLKISVVWGVERAMLILERTIDQNYIPYQYMAVISGVNVKSEMEISDGIRLTPLPNSNIDLPDYLPISGLHLTASDFMSKTLMLIDCSTSPAFFRFTDGGNFWRQIDQRVTQRSTSKGIRDFQPGKFCDVLSLICNNAVYRSIWWTHLKEDEICSDSTPGGVSYVTTKISIPPASLGESQIEDSKILYSQLLNLDSEIREILEVAISRWKESKICRNALVDAMIDLGIAFDSLYLDPGWREQQSYTLRIRAAWYLGKDAQDRKYLMRLFGKMYALRSKAVHSGKLEGKKKIMVVNDKFSIQQFVEKSQDLCLQSILKIIRTGKFPDWDSLVVGENAT